VHRKNPSSSFEFLTSATTDNVETAKNFKLWTELNFLAGVELLRLTPHYQQHAAPHGDLPPTAPKCRCDTLQPKLIQTHRATGTGRVPRRSDEVAAAGAGSQIRQRRRYAHG
jgi:hypothetical protein